jgi:hypothetical protein
LTQYCLRGGTIKRISEFDENGHMFSIPGLWAATRGLSKLYLPSVSALIDKASISLIFRKISIMVTHGCWVRTRGRFCPIVEFSDFLGKTHPLCVPTQTYSCENAAAPNLNRARPQTKVRTDRKLLVLYYISYGCIFPIQITTIKNRPGL